MYSKQTCPLKGDINMANPVIDLHDFSRFFSKSQGDFHHGVWTFDLGAVQISMSPKCWGFSSQSGEKLQVWLVGV